MDNKNSFKGIKGIVAEIIETDFFEELNISQLKKLRAHMYKKTYLQKEIIYKKGQEAKLLCIVRSGKIELDDGKNKKIINKRDLFGQKYAFSDNEVYITELTTTSYSSFNSYRTSWELPPSLKLLPNLKVKFALSFGKDTSDI